MDREQELRRLAGRDHLLRFMLNHNLPLTREQYIGASWTDDARPEEWTAEHELSLPEPFQQFPVKDPWGRDEPPAAPSPAPAGAPGPKVSLLG